MSGASPDEAELAFKSVGVPPALRMWPCWSIWIFPFVPSPCSNAMDAQWLHVHHFRGSGGQEGGGVSSNASVPWNMQGNQTTALWPAGKRVWHAGY